MLQIFISKKVVKKYVYHSKAFGIPIDTELDVWLATPEAVGKELDGQGVFFTTAEIGNFLVVTKR